ncbi:hypothetical protein FGO68_gene10265 [Halteria grandinella]|uniref:Uncharacterized protein n=1 Tax=Halteria grandinella TaxID=5974 RepID=A0A8J8P1W5_HALGN|nr:hypothetical protein FGO68_gene10265 [Halteria grandinella]
MLSKQTTFLLIRRNLQPSSQTRDFVSMHIRHVLRLMIRREIPSSKCEWIREKHSPTNSNKKMHKIPFEQPIPYNFQKHQERLAQALP